MVPPDTKICDLILEFIFKENWADFLILYDERVPENIRCAYSEYSLTLTLDPFDLSHHI